MIYHTVITNYLKKIIYSALTRIHVYIHALIIKNIITRYRYIPRKKPLMHTQTLYAQRNTKEIRIIMVSMQNSIKIYIESLQKVIFLCIMGNLSRNLSLVSKYFNLMPFKSFFAATETLLWGVE